MEDTIKFNIEIKYENISELWFCYVRLGDKLIAHAFDFDPGNAFLEAVRLASKRIIAVLDRTGAES